LKNDFICYYAFKGQINVGFSQVFANFMHVFRFVVGYAIQWLQTTVFF